MSTSYKKLDIKEGDKFGKLTVVHHVNSNIYLCSCSCGKKTNVPGRALLKGEVKSCGCLKRGRKKKLYYGKCCHCGTIQEFYMIEEV